MARLYQAKDHVIEACKSGFMLGLELETLGSLIDPIIQVSNSSMKLRLQSDFLAFLAPIGLMRA